MKGSKRPLSALFTNDTIREPNTPKPLAGKTTSASLKPKADTSNEGQAANNVVNTTGKNGPSTCSSATKSPTVKIDTPTVMPPFSAIKRKASKHPVGNDSKIGLPASKKERPTTPSPTGIFSSLDLEQLSNYLMSLPAGIVKGQNVTALERHAYFKDSKVMETGSLMVLASIGLTSEEVNGLPKVFKERLLSFLHLEQHPGYSAYNSSPHVTGFNPNFLPKEPQKSCPSMGPFPSGQSAYYSLPPSFFNFLGNQVQGRIQPPVPPSFMNPSSAPKIPASLWIPSDTAFGMAPGFHPGAPTTPLFSGFSDSDAKLLQEALADSVTKALPFQSPSFDWGPSKTFNGAMGKSSHGQEK